MEMGLKAFTTMNNCRASLHLSSLLVSKEVCTEEVGVEGSVEATAAHQKCTMVSIAEFFVN